MRSCYKQIWDQLFETGIFCSSGAGYVLLAGSNPANPGLWKSLQAGVLIMVTALILHILFLNQRHEPDDLLPILFIYGTGWFCTFFTDHGTEKYSAEIGKPQVLFRPFSKQHFGIGIVGEVLCIRKAGTLGFIYPLIKRLPIT
ncbi:hypothetical protein CS542_05805 [Pedobacter sp. IW39]|nr:hypothetical protein CS542_05805 [Pedobacter sp. IW39]